MIRMTEMVKHLLIINIIFFVASYVMPHLQSLLALYYFENPQFHFWQPLTHMFMHGGPMHLFFNMFALVSFGSALEQFWGGKKFLFFYFSCGLGAMLLHTGVNYYEFNSSYDVLVSNGLSSENIETLLERRDLTIKGFENIIARMYDSYNIPAVGASGAIYGLLVAFAFMFPNAELALMFVPVPIKAKYFVPGLLAIDLYLGLKGASFFGSGGGTGIAHFAHLGGALFGYIMMWYWKRNQFNNNRWN
ncbi:rhomboid family intramembrane serine protease [Flavobacterium chuncheonense]|uniref:Rhomboid family intramembrane serine protease n=1 Tax=Flavobacterium chuncheonense TaxID=2026653 RepID=A0ABW5YKL1_9FLAO